MRAIASRTRSFLSVLIVGAVLVGAGIANARLQPASPEAEVDCPTGESGGAPSDDGATEADLLSLEVTDDTGDGQECPPVEDEDAITDEGGEDAAGEEDPVAPEPSGDGEGDCDLAAGVVPDEGEEEVVEEKLTGLDNAIDHVLANCKKNEDAPGLLVALSHLAANRDNHEAHEEWKAERAAERAEVKAARFEDGPPGGNPHEEHPGGNPHEEHPGNGAH
jgi:hypothetical protein